MDLQPFQIERDLPLVSVWLNRPHVARWWGDSAETLAELRAHRPEAVAVITLDARPVGLLCWQTPSRAELSQAGLADLPSELIDVDILLGEEDAQGRGVGPAALGLLFDRLRAQGATLVGIAAAMENQRALAAYAKAGFQPYRDFVELGAPYRYFIRHLTDPA